MKKYLLILFCFVLSNSYSQTNYDFELKREDTNPFVFSVYAKANQSATNANLISSICDIFLPAGITVGNFTNFRGKNWGVSETRTGAQLLAAGFDDGTRDLIILASEDDSDIFSHTTDDFLLFTFEVLGSPSSGNIEIVSNNDPVVIALNGANLVTGNSFSINPQDGGGAGDRYNDIIGTTSYLLNDPTLSNNSFTKSDFSLTPNPNNGQFTITNAAPIEDATLSIYNITGQEVYRTSMNTFGRTTFNVNLSRQLTVGAYLLKIDNGNASKILKFIVN